MTSQQRVGYALGNAGFQITNHIVVAMGIYYYLPPGDVVDLTPQLAAGVFLGLFTAYGLARLVGGIVDSLADPLVGHYCDRSRSPWGRRRSFMIYGIAPMVAFAALLFWPPGEPGSQLNFVYLTIVLSLYFVFFTVYVGPYLALLPEIARSEADRVGLSRLFAIVGLPVLVLLGPAWQLFVGWGRSAGMGSEYSLRIAVSALSVLAFAMCLAPILSVDERKLPNTPPEDLSLRRAVGLTIRNRPFLLYLFAQIFFILGVTMAQPLVPYLAEVVLGRGLEFASLLGLLNIPLGIVGFVYAQRVVARLGPKWTIVSSVATLGVLLCLLGLLDPDVPGGPRDATNLVIVCGVLLGMGAAVAVFLIVPHVIIGQLIDRDEAQTGANRSAMYFGAQGLFTKWAFAASATIMSFLFVQYGNSRSDPEGVLLVGPVAGVLSLVAAVLYALYPEGQVLREGRSVHESNDPAGPAT